MNPIVKKKRVAGWLDSIPSIGDGDTIKYGNQEVPNALNHPSLPPLDPAFIRYANEPRDVANTTPQKQSTIQRVANIARNPMTALSYKVQGQDIPQNFELGDRNKFDAAIDAINPMTYLDAAGRTASLKHFRDEGFTSDALVKTGLDATMIYGVSRDYKIGSKDIANPINKVTRNQSAYNELLDLDKQRGFTLSGKGKLTSEQWDKYKQLEYDQWDASPRDPIRIPTIERNPPMEENQNPNRVTIPGMTYPTNKQDNKDYTPVNSQTTPYKQVTPNTSIKQIPKSTLKRSLQTISKPLENSIDTQSENNKTDTTYIWQHSHNLEKPVIDSIKKYGDGGKTPTIINGHQVGFTPGLRGAPHPGSPTQEYLDYIKYINRAKPKEPILPIYPQLLSTNTQVPNLVDIPDRKEEIWNSSYHNGGLGGFDKVGTYPFELGRGGMIKKQTNWLDNYK